MFCLAAPIGAAAQSDGLYLSGAIGGVWPQDAEFDGTGVRAEASFDPGLFGSLALGTTFSENWRGEAELSYRATDVDAITGTANGSGDLSGTAGMVNGYYDLFSGSDWRPYVGAGIGLMRLDADSVTPVGGSSIDDDDVVAAVQGIVGIGYRLNENFGLFTGYRFLATTAPEFTTAAGIETEGEYREHRIVVGLRWSFGGSEPGPDPRPEVKKADAAPMPADTRKRPRLKLPPEMLPKKTPEATPAQAAPPRQEKTARAPGPAKAPEANRRYLIYFDWDRWALDDAGRSIVRNAAEASTGPRTKMIRTTGHSDRSGPVPYNLTLSKRRAETVKAELLRLGVPVGALSVKWKGETQPVTQTADGVREPSNRRVEIILK